MNCCLSNICPRKREALHLKPITITKTSPVTVRCLEVNEWEEEGRWHRKGRRRESKLSNWRRKGRRVECYVQDEKKKQEIRGEREKSKEKTSQWWKCLETKWDACKKEQRLKQKSIFSLKRAKFKHYTCWEDTGGIMELKGWKKVRGLRKDTAWDKLCK